MTDLSRLEYLVQQVNAGMAGYVQAGSALQEIRDSRLYRARGFQSFELFCKQEWGMTSRRVNQQIQAAKLSENSETLGTIVPNEGQARALLKVPAGERADVLAEAASAGKVTAQSISAAAARVASLPNHDPIKRATVQARRDEVKTLSDKGVRPTDIARALGVPLAVVSSDRQLVGAVPDKAPAHYVAKMRDVLGMCRAVEALPAPTLTAEQRQDMSEYLREARTILGRLIHGKKENP